MFPDIILCFEHELFICKCFLPRVPKKHAYIIHIPVSMIDFGGDFDFGKLFGFLFLVWMPSFFMDSGRLTYNTHINKNHFYKVFL